MKKLRNPIASGVRALLAGVTLAPMAWAGVVLCGSMFVGGCGSSTPPQSLNGNSSQQMDWYDRQKYVDEKGHFHPEWVHDNAVANSGT